MLLAYLLAASPESQLRNGARFSISRNAFTAPPAPRSMALSAVWRLPNSVVAVKPPNGNVA